jgi:hypothetical protein
MLIAEQNGGVPAIKVFRGDFGPRDPIVLTKAASAQTMGYGANIFEEYGRSGLRHWGGFVFEEWLQQLQQGRRAAEVYREMSDQDPIIGAILYAIQMLMRRVTWWFEEQDTPGSKWMNEARHDQRTDVVPPVRVQLQRALLQAPRGYFAEPSAEQQVHRRADRAREDRPEGAGLTVEMGVR